MQVLAQLELWKEKNSGKYEKKVYVLPKHLDEKVAALHLGKLGAKLTKLTKSQADYISVPIDRGSLQACPLPVLGTRLAAHSGRCVL